MNKPLMVQLGNFFFKFRNRLFPLIIVALFALAPPPASLFGSEHLERLKDTLALAIALAGLAFRGWVIGFVYIKRGGMDKKVYAANLVTEGIFGLCRNPLYVGNMLIYIGVFLMHGNPWVTITGIALFFFIYQCIIAAEEFYLTDKFGAGYQDYCRDVSRWIPNFAKLKEATSGMGFNFRRVIIKDYSTIATTIITLCLTKMYGLAAQTKHLSTIGSLFFVAVIVVVLAAAYSIRFMKKRKIITE